MRDGQHRAPLARLTQGILNLVLRLAVQRACGFVEQQDRRVFQQGPRDTDTLLFPPRQFQPAFTHSGFIPVGQTLDKVVDLRRFCRRFDVFLRGVIAAIGDVIADGIVEQHGILRHHANRAVQTVLGHIAHILPVHAHGTALHIVEPEQQTPDGGFPRSGRADNRHHLARGGFDRHTLEDLSVVVIAKAHVVQRDTPTRDVQRRGIRLVRDFGRLIEQREHLPHIDQRLTDFAIDGAKEVQRHGQLHHIGVDHDEIPHGKITVLHPDSGQDHHADQPAGDQQRLAEVQEGKRVVRLDRRLFIARHRRVITLCLALFGDEILDGFIVQQAVDGLLVGICVAVVHLAAQLHAPLGHREGKPNVKPDGDRHDQ